MNQDHIAEVCNPHIKKLVDSIAEEEGFCCYKTEIYDGSEKGDGHFGVITAVRIVEKYKTNQDRALSLIVKSASTSEALRKKTPLQRMYGREIHTYNTVLPAFRKLEKEKGLLPSYFAPQFYKGVMTDLNETLILKNLKEDGYRIHEKTVPLNNDHVSLVLAKYACFHALSLALRDQNIEEFKRVAPTGDIFVEFMKQTETIQSAVIQFRDIQKVFNSMANEDADKAFDTFIVSIEPFLDELQNSVDDYSVVLHGDCWTGNILFKYANDSRIDTPTQVRFIDFQIARLGSPVLDLSYFLYTCSSKEIINKLDHYLTLYYSNLSSYLLKLGSDPSKVFPYSVLQEHWKLYAKLGLITSVFAIRVILTEKSKTIDLSYTAESGQTVGSAFLNEIADVNEYNDRMIHIIKHFIENKFF